MKVVNINARNKFNRSEICKNAWKLVRQFGASFGDAMAAAWEVAKGLKSFSMITFTKKDGTLTTRFCIDKYKNPKTASNFKFYDLRAKGCRSAVKMNIHNYKIITVNKVARKAA